MTEQKESETIRSMPYQGMPTISIADDVLLLMTVLSGDSCCPPKQHSHVIGHINGFKGNE